MTLSVSSVSPAPAVQQKSWQQALPVFLLLMGWGLFLYRDTARAIVTIWMRSDTFTHGFLVLPIVLWLVWLKRNVLAQHIPQPNFWGLALLAVAAFSWLLGDLVAINTLTQLAFVAMLAIVVLAVLGTSVTRAIFFPLGFLFFAVPFGEFAMPQLMVWTADFTVLALRLSGIPVYREGLQFVIPSGNWSVVEACSGVRYLIASVTVGTLFAYLNYQSLKRRMLFVLVSFLVPVVANWLRAYLIVMLGHLSGNKLAAGVDHLIYGWLFFGVVIMLMFMVGARWAEPEADPVTLTHTRLSHGPASYPTRLTMVAAAVAVVLALPLVARREIEQVDMSASPSLVAPAVLADGWTASQEPLADWQPAFQNPSAQTHVTYQRGAHSVGLFLAYYRQQDYSHKLVSSENVLVKTKDPTWVQVSRGTQQVNFNGKTSVVRTGELRHASMTAPLVEERLTVWQIYWVNGTLTSSDSLAKAYGALYRLLGRGDDAAVIMLYALKGRAGEGDRALDSFVQANALSIDALLRQTRMH